MTDGIRDTLARRQQLLQKMQKHKLIPLKMPAQVFFRFLYAVRALFGIFIILHLLSAAQWLPWDRLEGDYIFSLGCLFVLGFLSTARGMTEALRWCRVGIVPTQQYAAEFVRCAQKYPPDIKNIISSWLEKSPYGVISAQDMHFAMDFEQRYLEDLDMARVLYCAGCTRKELYLWTFLGHGIGALQKKRNYTSLVQKDYSNIFQNIGHAEHIQDFLHTCRVKRERKTLEDNLLDSFSSEQNKSRPVKRM